MKLIELAERTGYSHSHLRRLAMEGMIPGCKQTKGGHWRISKIPALEIFLRDNEKPVQNTGALSLGSTSTVNQPNSHLKSTNRRPETTEQQPSLWREINERASEIDREREAIETIMVRAVDLAYKQGAALLKVQELCKYGDWYDELDKNFRESITTAQAYMRCYRIRCDCSNTSRSGNATDLLEVKSIRQALKALGLDS